MRSSYFFFNSVTGAGGSGGVIPDELGCLETLTENLIICKFYVIGENFGTEKRN